MRFHFGIHDVAEILDELAARLPTRTPRNNPSVSRYGVERELAKRHGYRGLSCVESDHVKHLLKVLEDANLVFHVAGGYRPLALSESYN